MKMKRLQTEVITNDYLNKHGEGEKHWPDDALELELHLDLELEWSLCIFPPLNEEVGDGRI